MMHLGNSYQDKQVGSGTVNGSEAARNGNGTRTGVNSMAQKPVKGPMAQQKLNALSTATGNNPFRAVFGKIMGWTDQQAPTAPTPPGDPQNVYSPAGALKEAQKQRPLSDKIAKGLRAVATLAGMPGMSAAIGLGDAMGAASEDVMAQHPDLIHTVPGVPGAMYARINGVMYSNRADVPGYHDNLGKQNGSQKRMAPPVTPTSMLIGKTPDNSSFHIASVQPGSSVSFGDLLKVYGG